MGPSDPTLVSGTKGDHTVPLTISVDRPQDPPHLRMLKHILPQQVVLLVAGVGQLPHSGERQVAVGVQTDGDSQGIRREVTLKRIVTDDMEGAIRIRSHVEAAVAEGVKSPVATVIVRGHLIGEIVGGWFQVHRELATEDLPGDGKSMILGNDLAGQMVLCCHDVSPVVDVDGIGIGVVHRH